VKVCNCNSPSVCILKYETEIQVNVYIAE